MRTNKVLEKMRLGEKAVGAGMTFSSEEIVELLGVAGLDFIYLDGQHGSFSPESVERLCRVADQVGLTPIVRVPDIEDSTILRYLDRGVMGIMAPNIDTKDQALALIQACKFGPEGKRSFDPSRGCDFGLATDRKGWMARANANILVIAQIESETSLNNLQEILDVPGIDLFALGPNDLAQSMGLSGEPDHPRVTQATAKAVEQIHKAGRKLNYEVMDRIVIQSVILDAAQRLISKAQKEASQAPTT